MQFVKGMLASRIRKNPIAFGVTTSTISGIIRGSFNPEAYSIFMGGIETEPEPEMLERLFEREKIGNTLSSIFSFIQILISMPVLK